MTTFNEYRKQQEALRENTLYTDLTSKQTFVTDEKAMMSAFMFNFVGMLIGYNIIKDKQRAHTYFKNDLKLQLNNISDENNNMSLIIKLLDDKGAFKSSTTAAQITRFLVKLKQGGISEVDPTILIEWMNGIKDSWWSKLGSHLKVTKEEFIIDKDQYKAFMNLRVRARVQTDVSKDFFDAFRGLNVEKSKITAWDVDMMSKKSIDHRLANIGGISKAISPPTVTPTVQPSVEPKKVEKPKKPEKIEKQEWPGNIQVVAYFVNGGTLDNFNNVYKSTAEQRKGALIASLQMIMSTTNEPQEQQLKELAKFITTNVQSKNVLSTMSGTIDSAIRLSKNYAHMAKRLLIAQNIGLFDGVINACDYAQFKYTMQNVFGGLAKSLFDNPNAANLKEAKETVSKLDHGIRPGYISGGQNIQFINSYLKFKTVDEFIISLGSNVQNVNGTSVLSYTDSEFDWNNNTIKAIMNEYHLSKSDKDNIILAYAIRTTGTYGYGYDFDRLLTTTYGAKPFSAPALQSIEQQLIQIIDQFDDIKALTFIRGILSYISGYEVDLLTDKLIAKLDEFAKKRMSSTDHENVLNVFSYTLSLAQNRKLDKLNTHLISFIVGAGIDLNSILRRIRSTGITPGMPSLFSHFVRLVRANASLRKDIADKIHESALDMRNIDTYSNQVYIHITQRNNIWDILTSDEQTALLNDIVFKLSTLNELSGRKSDTTSILQSVAGIGKVFTYKDLNAKTKPAYMFIHNATGTMALTDSEFIAAISDTELQKIGYHNLSNTIGNFDEAEKTTIFTRYFSNPDKKRIFIDTTQVSTLNDMLAINEYTDAFKDDIDSAITRTFQMIKQSNRQHSVSDILENVNTKDYKNISKVQKDAIFKSTLDLMDDATWIKKQSNYFKDNVGAVQEYFDNMVDEDRAGAQKMYDKMSYNMRARMAESYLTKAGFSSTVEGLLHNDESPIVPYQKLDKKRIKEILKYNNVSNAETKVPAKFTKTFDTMDAYIKDVKDNDYSHGKLEGQKVEVVNASQEDLDRISVDLHRNKRNGRHGDTTLRVIKSFKVSIPIQEEQQKAWMASHEGEEIINPMFHGTGSIGASMILRYGFRVLKSGDSLVVGRMLGDGIYGSNIIDKAQQYVGDTGFSRRYGTKGYIFKMNAALGTKGVDYKVAGLGSDSIRSPEWCVFTPNAQFKIYQAYEVELISPTDMNDLLKKYQQAVTEKSFKDYLTEQIDEKMNYTTYTFINGILPNGPNPENVCDFTEFKSPSDKITLEPSAYGPTIVVAGTENNMDYTFTSVRDFRVNYPKEYEKFLKYFN
jgi:hypothetical protein